MNLWQIEWKTNNIDKLRSLRRPLFIYHKFSRHSKNNICENVEQAVSYRCYFSRSERSTRQFETTFQLHTIDQTSIFFVHFLFEFSGSFCIFFAQYFIASIEWPFSLFWCTMKRYYHCTITNTMRINVCIYSWNWAKRIVASLCRRKLVNCTTPAIIWQICSAFWNILTH